MDRRSLSTRARVSIGLATVLVVAVAGGAALAASSTPAGGSFRVFGYSNGQGNHGTVLLTGAIGDHGKNETVNKNGKFTPNGGYVKLTLTQGTLTLNIAKLNAAINTAFGKAVPNTATCSVSVVASTTIPFVSGTGTYTGASGSTHITLAFGEILPRFKTGAKAGQCNFGNSAVPVGSEQVVSGAGTVSFK